MDLGDFTSFPPPPPVPVALSSGIEKSLLLFKFLCRIKVSAFFFLSSLKVSYFRTTSCAVVLSIIVSDV